MVGCAVGCAGQHRLELAHRVRLRIAVKATKWLSFDARAALEHRTYWEPGEYRLAAGGTELHDRVDVTQHYRLAVSFLLAPKLHLSLSYAYTQNHSTIDAETVGIEEGYDRHQVAAMLSYRHW